MRYLLLLLLCVLFYLFPQIDLYVSALFFDGDFYLKNTLFAKAVYRLTIVSVALFVIGVAALLLYENITKKEIVRRRVLVYLLLALLLGPGLLVNVVFKDHWGRARPSQIAAFGGSKKFTPAFVIADQCEKNCSFTSGHAAAAFYFLALVPLFEGRKRRIALIAALSWGSLVGFVRIIQGGHFLSDVVCSAVFVYIVSDILYKLIVAKERQ